LQKNGKVCKYVDGTNISSSCLSRFGSHKGMLIMTQTQVHWQISRFSTRKAVCLFWCTNGRADEWSWRPCLRWRHSSCCVSCINVVLISSRKGITAVRWCIWLAFIDHFSIMSV